MNPDDRAALRDIADHLPDLKGEVKGLREEVQKSRKMIKWLVRACIVLSCVVLAAVGVVAYQQTVLTGQQHVTAKLEDQNADRVAADARHAHSLCVRLNRSRTVIAGVWTHVQFRPGVDPAAQLAKVKRAEPLGNCPKVPPAGS